MIDKKFLAKYLNDMLYKHSEEFTYESLNGIMIVDAIPEHNYFYVINDIIQLIQEVIDEN